MCAGTAVAVFNSGKLLSWKIIVTVHLVLALDHLFYLANGEILSRSAAKKLRFATTEGLWETLLQNPLSVQIS